MKKYIILLILITTAAQAQRLGGYAKDDFKFLQKEIENLTPKVEFILLKNEEEYNSVRKEHLGVKWKNVSAFTLWNQEKGTCKIYIKDPAWSYEPEYIGHEVAHCIWGRFHKGDRGLRGF